MKHQEWSPAKRWNPFNSYKLLSQVYRWRKIQPGRKVPQPALVTVDPINVCNFHCLWCNSEFILRERNRILSHKALSQLADFLPKWQGCEDWAAGVEAVCIAGGGEPLLNKEVGYFIEKCVSNRVEVGVVTNGTNLDLFRESLAQCTWVGVSLDAGTSETFKRLKGVSSEDTFEKIVDNMARLVDYANSHNTPLSQPALGPGVSYKFLLHPENVGEIYQAAELAKRIGCKSFHLRPAGNPWDKLDSNFIQFGMEQVQIFAEQVQKSRQLEDETFSVYGVTHKFDSKFNCANSFQACYAIFMTAVFMPRTKECENEDAFVMGLCCDRRGDKRLELGRNLSSTTEIERLWGSKKHWEIFEGIEVTRQCPRCTYQPHNQIYQHVILTDNMTYKFI